MEGRLLPVDNYGMVLDERIEQALVRIATAVARGGNRRRQKQLLRALAELNEMPLTAELSLYYRRLTQETLIDAMADRPRPTARVRKRQRRKGNGRVPATRNGGAGSASDESAA